MDNFTVKNSIWKYLFYLLIALLFVAGGFLMIFTGDDWFTQITGGASALFFGAGALIFLGQIFDSRPRIEIDARGVFDRTLGVGVIEWRDIESAFPISIAGNSFIALKLKDAEKYLRKVPRWRKKLAGWNKYLGAESVNINLSGVNCSPADVIEIVNRGIVSHRRDAYNSF